MRWQAANLQAAHPSLLPSEPNDGDGRKSSETVEAALARLTKAYSTAIACVGALHRLEKNSTDYHNQENPDNPDNQGDNNDKQDSNDDTGNDPGTTQEAKKELSFREEAEKVATAARKTLEHAILLDPLIRKHSSSWFRIATELSESKDQDKDQDKDKDSSNKWAFVREPRPHPPTLTSSSHRSTVRELAYLALLNYADLLISCRDSNTNTLESTLLTNSTVGILERGVVKSLSLVHWPNIHDDQRLALACLCDASELDGTDPVLWLKLACSARRMSRLWILHGRDAPPFLRYERLERHALERGQKALPPNVPPNRLIQKAWREHEHYHNTVLTTDYDGTPWVEPETRYWDLDLPRYSWTSLGRMLLRACREEGGSPCVRMRISAMLVLPMRPLGTICGYLENRDIWNFEATCRGLSASIVSARASIEREQSKEHDKPRSVMDTTEGNDKEDEQEESASMDVEEDDKMEDAPSQSAAPSSQSDTNDKTPKPETGKGSAGNDSQPPPTTTARQSDRRTRSRSSKRVLSQLITSGKRAERDAKRGSVEFCMVASTLDCSPTDEVYKKVPSQDVDWKALLPIDDTMEQRRSNRMIPPKALSIAAGAESSIRLGDASMASFMEQCSGQNSGPTSVLRDFVVHTAMNVEEVFAGDQSDSMGLASIFVDCESNRCCAVGLTVCVALRLGRLVAWLYPSRCLCLFRTIPHSGHTLFLFGPPNRR